MRARWSTWQVFIPTTIQRCTSGTLDALGRVCHWSTENKPRCCYWYWIVINTQLNFSVTQVGNIPDGVMRAAERQSHMGSMKVSVSTVQYFMKASAPIRVSCVPLRVCVLPGLQHGLRSLSRDHRVQRLLPVPSGWAAARPLGREQEGSPQHVGGGTTHTFLSALFFWTRLSLLHEYFYQLYDL